jgi:uncharacterized protein (UPF0332 family)
MSDYIALQNDDTIRDMIKAGKLEKVTATPESVDNLLFKAEQSFEAAELMVKAQLWDSATSVIETCILQACTAFLQAQGLRTVGNDGKHAVALEVVAEQLPKLKNLIRDAHTARRNRNAVNYGDLFTTEKSAMADFETAKSLLNGMKVLIDSGKIAVFH